MKILILGNGGRENALALALKENDLYFYPKNLAFKSKALHGLDLVKEAKEEGIEQVIVGSEDFLVKGIADDFEKAKIPIFGPKKEAARLEGSKGFMKDFLKRHGIKTANFLSTSSYEEAKEFIKTLDEKIVVKADGLCAGKGVIIAKDQKDALKTVENMLAGSFGKAGQSLVIEEFLDGFELSIFVVFDGKSYLILPAVQDHKKLQDGDLGPNTGGMGTFAPSPNASTKLLQIIEEKAVKPTIAGIKADGLDYKGVIFIGLMIVENEPYVLEYNVRFGDPETQVLLPLIQNPLELFLACSKGKLHEYKLKLNPGFALCSIAASLNYPYKKSQKEQIYFKGKPLTDISVTKSSKAHLCFAGISLENEFIFADGGRILGSVGLGKTLDEARDNSYNLLKKIHFEGMQYRKDIGKISLQDK